MTAEPKRSRIQAIASRIRAEQRHGTISLRGLPPGVTVVAAVGLALVVLTIVTLMPNLLVGWWPSPVVRIPGHLLAEASPGRISVPLYLLAVAMLGAAAASLAAAAAHAEARRRRAILLLLGFLGLSVGATIVGLADLTAVLADPPAGAIRVTGWIVMAGGVLIAALPGPLARRVAIVAPLALLPFVAALVVAALETTVSGTIPFATPDTRWPQRIDGVGIAAGTLLGIVEMAGSLIGVLFLWQSVVAARAVRREVGKATARWVSSGPHLLFALLGAKSALVALALVGRLPAFVTGGSSAPFRVDIEGGGLGLAITVAFGLAIGFWLYRGTRWPVSDRYIAPVAAFFVLGFNLPFIVAAALVLALPIVAVISPQPSLIPDVSLAECLAVAAGNPEMVHACIASAVSDLIPYAGLVTWIVAVVAAVWAAQRRRPQLSLALLVVVLWTAAAALNQIMGLLGRPSETVVGRPDLAVLDLVVTLVVGVLAALWWMGRQRSIGPGSLALVLVVSTLIAWIGGLEIPGGGTVVIGILLLATAAYDLLFDSESVNEAGERRRELVPRALGLQLVGLGLLLSAIAFDRYRAPGADLAELFIPPVIALLVAADISRRRITVPAAAGRPRPLGRAIAWGAGGAVVAGSVLLLASILPRPTPAPRATDLYAEFLPHVDIARSEGEKRFQAMADAGGDAGRFETTLAEFSSFVDDERDWLAGRAAADCFAAEFARWQEIVDSMVAIRDGLATNAIDEAMVDRYRRATGRLEAGTSECQTTVPDS